MSGTQHVNAKIFGYNKPVFPDKIDTLNRAYDKTNFVTGQVLDEIGKSIAGYLGETRPTSSDGYAWFWVLKFDAGPDFRTNEKRKILVAFPWGLDHERHDGFEIDRSIAFYTRGRVADQDLNALLDAFVRAFKQQI